MLLALWQIIDSRQKFYCILIAVLMTITSFAEALSVGSIIPFLAVLSNPSILINNDIFQRLVNVFNFDMNNLNIGLAVTLIFVAAILIAAILRLALLWSVVTLSFRIGSSLSVKMFGIILHQDYEVHISSNSSRLISGITSKVDSIIFGAFMPCMFMISAASMLLAIVGSLLFFNFEVTLLIFGISVSIYLTIISMVKNKTLLLSNKIAENSAKAIKVIQEGLGGIRDVLLGGYQVFYTKELEKVDLNLKKSQASCNFIGQSPRYLIEAASISSIAIGSYFISSESGSLENSLPMLGAIAFGAQKLLPILQQGYAAYISLQTNKASLHDALYLLNQPVPDRTEKQSLIPLKFENEITFSEVGFHYKKTNKLILNNINLAIPQGSKVGIVGISGGGKSTFLDLLMGLLAPTKGVIRVDGADVDVINRHSWQKIISHVPQHVFLVHGTIAENIALGTQLDKIDIVRLEESIRQSQLSDVIMNLENGIYSDIGENGAKLSGGQRQRIGIARALYKRAQILVMDEATSALDSMTESNILNSIYELDKEKTVFIVTHRLSTLDKCDFLVEIKDGEIKIKSNEMQEMQR